MPHKSDLVKQLSQYIVVGGIAFTVDFATLYMLTQQAGLHYLLSATAGFLLGLLVNYLLCIRWIFDFRAVDKISHEFAIFAGVGIAGLLLNNLLMFIFTDWAGLHYLASKAVAAAAILIFNFSLRRALLFTNRQSSKLASAKAIDEILSKQPTAR